MELHLISEKYNYTFPDIFKKLWDDGNLDWYKGWNEGWTPERNWFTEIYPTIKDNPPILLHSGGFDFQMLSPKDILNYEFLEWWDSKHKFIPFARTNAGDMYAFYENITIDGDNPIVLVWHDDNRTEIVAKNFEDFIFRKMIERVVDVDQDNLDNEFEGSTAVFKEKLQADLKTASKYLNTNYIGVIKELYNRPFENIDAIIGVSEMNSIFQKTIHFDKMDSEFDHEIEE